MRMPVARKSSMKLPAARESVRSFRSSFPDATGFRTGAWKAGTPSAGEKIEVIHATTLEALAAAAKHGGKAGITLYFDDEDRPVPTGEIGEICVRGPNVMRGYYRLPEETARALRNGWLHTGDVGRLDADNFLYVVERKKDLIIKGGENISPREIEEALYEHPAVTEVVIVGVPDPRYGENIVAVVALKPGKTATEAELIAHASHYVTKFKLPKRIVFKDTLPKNANGKIDRKVLRAELIEIQLQTVAS